MRVRLILVAGRFDVSLVRCTEGDVETEVSVLLVTVACWACFYHRYSCMLWANVLEPQVSWLYVA